MKAALRSILDLIRSEPAMFIGLLAALLTLGASFGLSLGDKQQAAIMALAQILAAILVRSQVSPAYSAAPAALAPPAA